MVANGNSGLLRYGVDGQRLETEIEVFVNSSAPKARLIIFGAIDFAAALARLGKFLGYHVTVCDARPIFATRKRFPDADEVVVDWPHRYLATQTIDSRTVIAVLTHDPKFDVPVLKIALESSAGYVGAMGSRRTHRDRVARLRDEGVRPESVARLHSPIGLDLGSRTPEETALSIKACSAQCWRAVFQTSSGIGPVAPASGIQSPGMGIVRSPEKVVLVWPTAGDRLLTEFH